MGSWLACARTAVVRSSIYSAAVLVAAPAAALTFRTVALTNDTAPGTGGASYLTFGPAVLNSDGRVAFVATLALGGAVDASNDLGMWSEGSGALGLVERQGSPAAGVAGTWNVATQPPVLNDAGQVAFQASVSGGPSPNGVFHQGSGTLDVAAATGLQAGGAPAGQSYAAPFSDVAFNDAGQVAFHAGLAGGGVTPADDAGVWAGGPTGPLTLVAREGAAAPGTASTWVDFDETRINASGGVAFLGTLGDGGEGIWAGPAGGVSLAARDGSAAPGTVGGVFANFIPGDFNDQGRVAFHAGLAVGTGDATFANDRGIWAGAPGSLILLAREGGTAPDSGGRVFESFSGPLINDVGDVLFRGFLDVGTGLYLDDGSSLDKVVASDDAAPGTAIGPGPNATFAGFTDHALNDAGDVVFEAVLGGLTAGVTGSNDESLWLRSADGVLTLIVREGMLWELGLGDSQLVTGIDFHGAADSLGRGLSDLGHVTFGLTFQDGREGVFVLVPEPGTAALLALGMLGLALRRRAVPA